jgi:hypothetical protein
MLPVQQEKNNTFAKNINKDGIQKINRKRNSCITNAAMSGGGLEHDRSSQAIRS